MTPGARVQAAIEVLDAVLDGAPAERELTAWARRSRFAGSKDRAAVRDHVFQALRCRNSYAALGGGMTGRALMIGAVRAEGLDLAALFSGQGHAPEALSPDEEGAGQLPATPKAIHDLPDWLVDRFAGSLGGDAEGQAQLLRDRAPVCLRVNQRKMTREATQAALAEAGITTRPVAMVNSALIVTDGARKVAQSPLYQDGLIELQDAASQAAMAALDIPNGARVLDYCAGGGGKTLALGARAEATWFAHDAEASRMGDLPVRAARAGQKVTVLAPGKVAQAGPFDIVLCDVPCSGSGTWRRAPEAKWRLTPDRLQELCAIQAEILRDVQGCVRPGGMLAYATCSVLREENEAQIDRFLSRNPDWGREDQRRWPIAPDHDGFFLSILRAPQP